MSPETQDLEMLLQNITPAEGSGGGQAATTREFDAFFEKLSTLDDLSLSQPHEEQLLPEPKPIRLRQGPPTNGNGANGSGANGNGAARHKMQVLHSSSIQSDASGGGGSAMAGQGGTGTILKVFAAGLILFAVGLGSGWLALTLPFRSNSEAARMLQQPTPVKAIVSSAIADSIAEINVDGDAIAEAAAPAPDARDAESQAQSDSTPAIENAAASSKSPPAKSIVKVPAQISPIKSTPGGRYAIQVGACGSQACVAKYRKALLHHVGAESIQVIERKLGATQEIVRRIRVISLTKGNANKLRSTLAAANSRFKDAYVVAIFRSPSG